MDKSIYMTSQPSYSQIRFGLATELDQSEREKWRSLLCNVLCAGALMLPTSGSKASSSLGLDQLAVQIVARSADADRTTIAISSFPHVDNTCSELSNFLVDELVLSLFSLPDNDISIIERSQLDRIFAELELSMSGAVDANTTQELGRVHGVGTLLVGTLSTIGEDLRINARLIDTETAQVYSAAAINIPLTSTFKDLMERPATGGCTTTPAAGKGERDQSAPQAERRPAPSFEISLPDIDENFEIASLEGLWSGQLSCNGTSVDRAMTLFSPSRIGLQAYYFHSPQTGSSSYAEAKTTLTFDMFDGNIGNSFTLNTDPNIPLQLVAKDVLYGQFIDSETQEKCALYMGKYK